MQRPLANTAAGDSVTAGLASHTVLIDHAEFFTAIRPHLRPGGARVLKVGHIPAAVASLRELGVRAVMLTGDSQTTAERVTAEVAPTGHRRNTAAGQGGRAKELQEQGGHGR